MIITTLISISFVPHNFHEITLFFVRVLENYFIAIDTYQLNFIFLLHSFNPFIHFRAFTLPWQRASLRSSSCLWLEWK
jgi:hypothetical protein